MTTDRNDPVHRLIALMDLVPDGYPEDVRGPLREARDRAAKHLAAALAPAWTAAALARDRVRDAAGRVGIAPSVWRRMQREVPEVSAACPIPPRGRPTAAARTVKERRTKEKRR